MRDEVAVAVAFGPLFTKMSAMPLTISSLKSLRQCVVFQLLKPIGGVRARPSSFMGCWARAAGAMRVPAAMRAATAAVRHLR
jgi:hypothetical protein